MSTAHPSITVRIATPSDLPVCLNLEKKDEFGRHTALDEKILLGQIAAGAVFLAEHLGDPVGYASLNFLYASKTPLLSWWYVEDRYRNQGVGSMLLKEIERYLSSLGFDRFLISACRTLEIERHRAAGLEEIGILKLSANEVEYFFAKSL